jgi:hypothetical protein
MPGEVVPVHRSRVRILVLSVVLPATAGPAAGCAAAARPSAAPPDATAPACLQATDHAPWHGLLRLHGARATLDAFDDYFSPNCLVVPPGRSVTLVLTDRGHLPHTLVGDGVAVAASVDAGETTFVTLPPLTRPTRLVCGLHEDQRMVLAVVPAAGSSGDV